eukprot:4361413-Prymnesium_polylepis.1
MTLAVLALAIQLTSFVPAPPTRTGLSQSMLPLPACRCTYKIDMSPADEIERLEYSRSVMAVPYIGTAVGSQLYRTLGPTVATFIAGVFVPLFLIYFAPSVLSSVGHSLLGLAQTLRKAMLRMERSVQWFASRELAFAPTTLVASTLPAAACSPAAEPRAVNYFEYQPASPAAVETPEQRALYYQQALQ